MHRNMKLQVSRIVEEADGIRSFELVHPEGGTLPEFSAGAHIDIHIPDGPVRQYSLLNDDVERGRYVIAVLKVPDGRGGSAFMHDSVKTGTSLVVGEPRNAFPLENSEAPAVLVAGGIGITPLLSMARRLSREERPFVLHFATRSVARTPFVNDLRESALAQHVRFYRGDGPSDQRLDVARLTNGIPTGTHVYLCGPVGFMNAVSASLSARSDVTLHTEYFTAPVDPAASLKQGGAFNLVLARKRFEMTVAADRTIVNVLREHGIEPDLNCEQGICGTCQTTVLSGDVEHHDYCLSPRERECGNKMMICVSRGKPGTTLTLDL